MNPPYGPSTGKWLEKLADHGRGTALIFARTETKTFFRYVWGRAVGALFLRGRIHFHRIDGTRADFNAGAPSVLVAYGWKDANRLRDSDISGHYVMIDPIFTNE